MSNWKQLPEQLKNDALLFAENEKKEKLIRYMMHWKKRKKKHVWLNNFFENMFREK